jgi:hypothetical protein
MGRSSHKATIPMAKATRVHSTPPTNTSARHSRRSILGAIAGSAAAAGGIAAAEGINLSTNKINVLAPKTPQRKSPLRRASKAIRSLR